MNDLFKKLNTLVKASINDWLGEDKSVGGPRRRPLRPDRLGKNVDSDVKMLRARVNDAVAYEDKLQAQVQALREEVARLDQQADDAVTTNNDSAARYAVEQMQQAQQRLAMAEADLAEHQSVTQELIRRVNTLDAVVADARRAQDEKTDEPVDEPVDQAETGTKSPGQVVSGALRDARQTINRVGEMIASRNEMKSSGTEVPQTGASADESAVEDDLESRRQRLSKPKPK